MLALKHSKKIRGIITRHEQAASFMACGYAMFTDKLGVCFATAGPGRLQPVLGPRRGDVGLLPGAGDLGLCVARVAGQGLAQRDLGPQPDARLADDVRGHDQEVVPAHRRRRHAATCSRRRSTSPSRAGPGRCTSTSRRTSPTTASRSTNYRDIRLDVAPVLPDPARVEEIADGARRRVRQAARRSSRWSASARSAAAPAPRSSGSIERFQIPLLTTLDGKGIVAEGHPLCGRRVLRQRPRQRLEGVPRGRRRARDRQRASTSTPRSTTATTCSTDKTLIHVNISDDEIDKAYKADYALVADAQPGGRSARRRARAEGRRGRAGRRSTARTTRRGTSCT